MLKFVLRPHQKWALRNRSLSTLSSDRSFKCAIIGSGPAGFYTAHRLLSQNPDCYIDIYEALPVPFGLARYGVAPDHPEVKNVTHKFDEVASSDRVRFLGNVRVGYDIDLKGMATHYHSIVFTYGASSNRVLSIPGEDLPGVVTARSFVGWYNGQPESMNIGIPLHKIQEAVVIGQGNVALDIARILLTKVDDLRTTDISDQALQTLATSKVKSVKIIGRRGPLQASFTIKEVRELVNLPKTHFINRERQLYMDALARPLARPQKRLMELLAKSVVDSNVSSYPQWDLCYCLSPTKFVGSDTLEGVEFQVNELQKRGDRMIAVGQDRRTTEEAQVAFTSIGYKAEPLQGMADIGIIFDTNRNIIPNELGRVQALDGSLPGLYCSGWVKNGPVGVIASTMRDAYETADNILLDWRAGLIRPIKGDLSSFLNGLQQRCEVVDWGGWKRIEQSEIDSGRQVGRPTLKVTDVQRMLQIAAP